MRKKTLLENQIIPSSKVLIEEITTIKRPQREVPLRKRAFTAKILPRKRKIDEEDETG